MYYDLATKPPNPSPITATSPSPSPNLTTLFIEPSGTPPTQPQIDIVRYTWERIAETRLETDDPNISPVHAFSLEFYDALFQVKPSLRELFPNIFQQAKALAGMISFITRAPSVVCDSKKNTRRSSDSEHFCSIGSAYIKKDNNDNDKTLSNMCPAMNSKNIMSLRELNALKRQKNTASNFAELVTNTAAADKQKNCSSTSLPNSLLYVNDIESSAEYHDTFLQKIRELGARHYFYHTDPKDLPLVVPAVLHALRTRLGREYLPEVEEAWIKAQAYLIYHMKVGLAEETALQHGGKKKSAFAQFKSSVHHHQYDTKTNCTIQ
ncbi:hypothetical protein BDF20DRAFT_845725 [Mycotypha africana]|uniref:uncharacterized protein n=1 Tax=Mycotypha africana TaxID=64632 RepID=UPI002300A769|nr:uncharacterized protein BDF20DRAFT_845725 [Mycotypha africana]KAI8991660.1 hypothetical protein BDF20DRAFT_845725 [Mycotypha africana]